jgi:hypothetical protein
MGNGLRSSDGGAAADGPNEGHVSFPQGGTDDLLPAEEMEPDDKGERVLGRQQSNGPPLFSGQTQGGDLHESGGLKSSRNPPLCKLSVTV